VLQNFRLGYQSEYLYEAPTVLSESRALLLRPPLLRLRVQWLGIELRRYWRVSLPLWRLVQGTLEVHLDTADENHNLQEVTGSAEAIGHGNYVSTSHSQRRTVVRNGPSP
jgi:hypothetical protein